MEQQDINRDNSFLLSFTDLAYHVNQPKKYSFFPIGNNQISSTESSKIILNSISGEVSQGEILAVLGPSGSGKSTLIDALANRIEHNSLHGTITINGEKTIKKNNLKAISSYVMQDDLLYPMLTVEETLMFSAELRLDRSVCKNRKKERVRELIEQLGLGSVKSTIIGDEGTRGISGGERRRVSIGVDIVHDPIVLFLDEPTSGLDSTSAFMVVKVLQGIAQRGSIVIMSIHQPSSRILNLLDRVLFLSHGNTVYYGPPVSLPRFFAEFSRPIPEKQNLAEFVLDLIHELESSPDGITTLVHFNKSWQERRNVPYCDENNLVQKNVTTVAVSHEPMFNLKSNHKFATPRWNEVCILTKRSFVNLKRTPKLFLTPLAAAILTGFILATLFWHLDGSPTGVTERFGFFNIAVTTMLFICMDSLPVFVQERYIFMRERANNMYRSSSYVLSRTISNFPLLIAISVTFTLITFFTVKLAGSFYGLLAFMATILASLWAGSGFALFLSGIISHVVLGYAIVVAMLRYFTIFSGFFINRNRIPKYWIWFHYISLIKYPYQAVTQNEFSDPNECFVRGVQMFDNTPIEPYPYDIKANLLVNISKLIGTNLTSDTCITTGPDLLEQYSVNDLGRWDCIWVLIGWGFVFRMMFYFVLLWGSKNKRK
ncbi:hypothetical protein LUZ60_003051 [Juncus effusus]|nr:hypothetical protein LUZ60_003051 [Juncus effusus]